MPSGYFETHYSSLVLRVADGDAPGLRNAQIGASHAVGSHFTLYDAPAIVSMPTGAGKTAVLMMAAFLARARRALVVTPSRLVRSQIAEEFSALSVLKRVGVIPSDLALPRVREVRSRLAATESWRTLEDADVVVATPAVISPALEGVVAPPGGLFDLLLVDEAHHTAAPTWKSLLEAFKGAKQVLFTATPFRIDRQEIPGRLAYHYPLSRAVKDGIFGAIRYVPVALVAGRSADAAIALAAERTLRDDQANELRHYLLVRTDTRPRAEELEATYRETTKLRLSVVHGGHSFKRVKSAVTSLRSGDLDGIICVDMFGEGFDFPNLKVAAIHAPHKSLGATLQFIGRFARPGDGLGEAKFLAVPSDIEFETMRLYEEDASWERLIANLSEGRIAREERIRETLSRFPPPVETTSATEDLSLYSLRPFCHVKVYRVDGDIDIGAALDLPPGFEVVYRQPSQELEALVLITRETERPRWSHSADFARSEFDLFVVYYDRGTRLLFINSSETKSLPLYEHLARQFTDGAHTPLSLAVVNRVLAGIENPEFFNIGMRNRAHTSRLESYRIIAGPNAQRAISETDGRMYHRGHVFGRGIENGEPTTLGYSSASKVWRNKSVQIPDLLTWCRAVASKLAADGVVRTGSALDHLSVGVEVDDIPSVILAVDWNTDAYEQAPTIVPNGSDAEGQLLDATIRVERDQTDRRGAVLVIEYRAREYKVRFSPRGRPFFADVGGWGDRVSVSRSGDSWRLIDYVNEYPLYLHLVDGSSLQGREHFPAGDSPEAYESRRIEAVDWGAAGVNIENEVGGTDSVHGYIRTRLAGSGATVVFYDHGSGEIADFVAVHDMSDEILIELYHCKGSGGPQPGNRVDDVYEVCGQAVKSVPWLKEDRLRARIARRTGRGSQFLKGDLSTLDNVLRVRTKRRRYQVVIVQPGIGSSGLSEMPAQVLAAANEYLRRTTGEDLAVMASA